ncbi:BsuBI/PstI family type II restriction endonuclease [Pseudomonas sp. NPDC086278]|uniref:BsuBI/PstI family type II restriction endonuclease n=1 Tax=Pseudomonas sp. NPDC086278 TaxID=3390646 RepID=UPI003D03B1AC
MDANIVDAQLILKSLGFPRGQQNIRSALTLLALLDLKPGTTWSKAKSRLIGISPIIDWMREHYDHEYRPNTRESVRRGSVKPFVLAGIALKNPDKHRDTNSQDYVYQIDLETLKLLRCYGKPEWEKNLEVFIALRGTLIARYAKEREMQRIPLQIESGLNITLSPGKHSKLIKDVVDEFGPCFVPDGDVIYVGDTEKKFAYFNESLLAPLGVKIDVHGKIPDVILYCKKRNWLILVEVVTSHGHVDGMRHEELAAIFAGSSAGIVYVTAMPSLDGFGRFLTKISWETEVWVADAPTHMIHFNGDRFLGPH